MKPSMFNVKLSLNAGSSVLFNTLTRSVVKVDSESYQKMLKNPDFISADAERFTKQFPTHGALKDIGFVTENQIDEFLVFKYWLNKEKFKNNCCVVTFAPLYRCNMQCVYCFEGGFSAKASPDMAPKTLKAAMGFMDKYLGQKKPRVLDFNLFGGEPLLSGKLSRQLISELQIISKKHSVRLDINVVTNGSLLSTGNLKLLSELGVKSLQITLDGEKEAHDARRPFKNRVSSFDVIYKNLLLAVDAGFSVVLNMNYDNSNYLSITRFLKKFPNSYRSRVHVKFSPIKVTKNNSQQTHKFPGNDSAEIFYKLTKTLVDENYKLEGLEFNEYGPCTFLRHNFFTIDPQGNIGKCIYGLGDPDFIIGSVGDDFDILMQNISQFVAVEPDLNGKCKKCSVLPLCMGGCRREALAANGILSGLLCQEGGIKRGFLKSLTYCLGKNQ